MKLLAGLNTSARLKRAFDVAGALAGLVLLSPLMLAAALCIRITMGGPVLFKQARTGRGGRIFTLYKLRTMRDGAHLPDADRLTALGDLFRSLSIDELPQFYNVLRGEMSLVGPRPLLPEYLPFYSAEQRRRLDVQPGITGWTQVGGRNSISWEEKFRLDVWYVDHATNSLDLAILFKTLGKVLLRDGINQPGLATVARFCPSALEGTKSL